MIANYQTIDEPVTVNPYREAAERYLQVMTTATEYVAESAAPQTAIWAVIYALGLPPAEGVSVTDRAEQIGISVGALSKSIRTYLKISGVSDHSAYSYKKS